MSNDINMQVDGEILDHYVSPRQKRGQPSGTGQPPLTPMIDVTFQLLLYFLLTSTFQEDEGQIPGTLPALGAGPGTAPIKPVRVVITRNGADMEKYDYKIIMPGQGDDGQLIPAGTTLGHQKKDRKGRHQYSPKLLQALTQAYQVQNNPKVPVKIEPIAGARWKYCTEVFNAAIAAGFVEIGFTRLGG